MGSPNVEDLDDEELLLLHDTTKKLFEKRCESNKEDQSGKKNFLLEKIQIIEEELKYRSLWEDE